MPVLFKEISDTLHLSVGDIGVVWGMDPLAGVFVGLPAGLLADRFGIKKTLTILCILAGIFGALTRLFHQFCNAIRFHVSLRADVRSRSRHYP